MVNDSVPSGHRVLQKIRDGCGEPDGVGGHGDGVGDGEHQTDGTSDRRTKGSRNHVVYTASGDLKKCISRKKLHVSEIHIGPRFTCPFVEMADMEIAESQVTKLQRVITINP